MTQNPEFPFLLTISHFSLNGIAAGCRLRAISGGYSGAKRSNKSSDKDQCKRKSNSAMKILGVQ